MREIAFSVHVPYLEVLFRDKRRRVQFLFDRKLSPRTQMRLLL